MGISKTQLGVVTVLLIVLMRLAAGFHFYAEGVKKLEPGFSSEGFLRGAKGPLAETFKAYAPGYHGAYELLAQPHQWGIPIETAVSGGEESASPIPSGKPYSDWADAINLAWQQQHDNAMRAMRASDETRTKADEVYSNIVKRLGDYFADNEEAIAEYQHELWRLQQMQDGYQTEPVRLPFLDERIADKQREVRTTPRGWIADIKLIEKDYQKQLAELAGDKQRESAAFQEGLHKAMNPATQLDRVNLAVTCVVLGCGVLLFLGLFTRVAAIVAAGFLASVIATQPPWVHGADTTVFYYQLFEIVGLLMLAAIGAGRWFGIDSLIGSCCCRACKAKD